MNISISCQGSFLFELNQLIKVGYKVPDLCLIFQESLLIISDPSKDSSLPGWIELDPSDRSCFESYSIKTRSSNNRIVLTCKQESLSQSLEACSVLPGTQVKIGLSEIGQQACLVFQSTVPEENESFVYEKYVEVTIEKRASQKIPEVPKSIECELISLLKIQSLISPFLKNDSFMQVCLTVEDCHVCKAKDSRDLDFVFGCNHNRKNFVMPEKGKLILVSRETTLFHIISKFLGLPLQKGQCSLYNIQTVVRSGDFAEALQKCVNFGSVSTVFGIQHEGDIVISASRRGGLVLRVIIPAQLDL
jgi:hypothetical protein